MPMKFRIGYPSTHHKHTKRAAVCDFWKSPTAGQTVDSLQILTVSWDPACWTDTQTLADMWLYAPDLDTPRIHRYSNVNITAGTYDAPLMPRWWNDTATMGLSFTMVPSGGNLVFSNLPAGPLFTATYTEPSTGAPPAADTSVKDTGTTNAMGSLATDSDSHLSKGKVAAAVIMPLLVVAAIIGGYIWWSRKKGITKRKEWTEKVDQRMSTISTDWKAMSVAGATAAVRHSMAGSGNRNSSFSFGAIRQSVAVDGGHAGVGARSLYSHENGSISTPSLRPGLRTSAFENRVSRVSFANDPRPSGESRRSRAYHIASTYDDFPVPPLPKLQDPGNNVDVTGIMSPRQTHGAMSLSPDEISARLSEEQRNSTFDEVLPALSLMRTDGQEDDTGSFYPSPSHPSMETSPSIPAPTHLKPIETPSYDDYYQGLSSGTTIFSASPLSPNYPTSPVSGGAQFGSMTNMQPMPAAMMSPDEMLRAYASRRSTATFAPITTPGNFAAPTNNRNSTYNLGSGVGFGAAAGGVTYPNPAAGGRSLVPASPGAFSPSRGAYGAETVYETGIAE